MSRSLRALAALVAATGLAFAASQAIAQSSGPAAKLATLDAPPTGSAPPGDVLRAGHLGREIGEMQSIIHFYSDLIGFGLVGERTAAKPFMVSRPLAEFAELGEDDDAYQSVSRVALLPIPGTSSAHR